MLRRFLVVPLLLAASAATASAQFPVGGLPPEQMEQAMAFARQAMNPAAALLAHRQELELTAAQVATLDSLSGPLDGFIDAQVRRQMSPVMTTIMQALMDPTAEIDEEGLRKAYRDQAEGEAELIIRMLGAERRIARLLTPAQNEKRQALQLNSMFGMMRAMGGGAAAPAP